MSTNIQTEQIGLSVFGQAQVAYAVNGLKGRSFDEAIAAAGFARTVALENAVPAYTAALEKRRTKLRELGAALADISRAAVLFSAKSSLSDTQGVSATTAATLSRYGISGVSDNKIKKENVQKVQADAQYAIDIENNAVQQDMTTLQGLMNKRDNAYSTIAKIVQKAIKTQSSGIGYIV